MINITTQGNPGIFRYRQTSGSIAQRKCSMKLQQLLSDPAVHLQSPISVNKRLKEDDPLKIDQSPKPKQQPSEKYTYMCGLCEKLFCDEHELMRHLREDHDQDKNLLNPVRYECSLCGCSYTYKLSLIKHLASHEQDIQIFSEEKIITKSKVRRKRNKIYKCDICLKVLANRTGFLRHMRVHADERPAVCQDCGKGYRIEEDLKRHMDDVHRKIKRYPCDLCEKFFAAKGTRDAHRRIHTGEKPFPCKICGKFFRSINLLGIHKRIHSDYRPHKCTCCEKAFRSKQKLEAHTAIHTGIKPYPCDVCGKTFAAKGEATRHRSVHFNDKPFLCSECGFAFRLNRYLKTHIKTRHVEKAEILLKSLTE